MALSYALWAVSHSFGLFVIARIIGGVSKGNISLSTAIVADIIPAKRRGKGMVSYHKDGPGVYSPCNKINRDFNGIQKNLS